MRSRHFPVLPYSVRQTPSFIECLSIPAAPDKCTARRDCNINPLPAIDQRIVVLEGVRTTLPGLTADERNRLASPDGAGLPTESVNWIGRMLPLQQVRIILHFCRPLTVQLVRAEPRCAVQPSHYVRGTLQPSMCFDRHSDWSKSVHLLRIQVRVEGQQRHIRNCGCTAHGPPAYNRTP